MTEAVGPAVSRPEALERRICIRVRQEVLDVWNRLDRSERMALTGFFKKAIVSFSSVKSIISVDVGDIAKLASVLKSSYDACMDALDRCESRCRDAEEVKAECRSKIQEYEKSLESLRRQLMEREAEVERLKRRLAELSKISRLRLVMCEVKKRHRDVEEELKRYGIDIEC